MSIYQYFDDLKRTIAKLDASAFEERRETLMNAVIEAGGSYFRPESTNWSSHMFEINLYGVSAYGANEDEAIRNWMMAARSIGSSDAAEIEADGFVTVHPKTKPQ